MGILKTFGYGFRALKYRNYQLFFGGQGISLIGTWMQRIAMSWLVYQLTSSALLLGTVSFLNQLPTFLLAPIAGVYVDRWDRHKTLLVTQFLSMLQALTLAILVIFNWIEVWHIVVLGATLGTINAFDMPVRQTFVRDIVTDPKDFPSAIALNSSLMNGARIIGPSIAGILISWIGEGLCFLINGLSYIGVLWALKAMDVPPHKPPTIQRKVWDDLVEGSRYTYKDPLIRNILILLSIVSLMGTSYTTLMPAVAAELVKGGPQDMGLLMGAVGVGAILGAIFFSMFSSFSRLGKWIPYGAIWMGISLMLFGETKFLSGSMIVLLGVGTGQIIQTTASNTLLQSISAPHMRGRIMSFYTMSFMGMSPFGALLAGYLAHTVGLSETFLIGGAACVISGMLFKFYVPLPERPPFEEMERDLTEEKSS